MYNQVHNETDLDENNRRIKFWAALEKNLSERTYPVHIEKHIKHIFKYCYLDNPMVLSNYARDEICFPANDVELKIREREYENFMRQEIGVNINDMIHANIRDEFYGRYTEDPSRFFLMPGDLAVIDEILKVVREIKKKSTISQKRFWGFSPSYPMQTDPLQNPQLESQIIKRLLLGKLKPSQIYTREKNNIRFNLNIRDATAHIICPLCNDSIQTKKYLKKTTIRGIYQISIHIFKDVPEESENRGKLQGV